METTTKPNIDSLDKLFSTRHSKHKAAIKAVVQRALEPSLSGSPQAVVIVTSQPSRVLVDISAALTAMNSGVSVKFIGQPELIELGIPVTQVSSLASLGHAALRKFTESRELKLSVATPKLTPKLTRAAKLDALTGTAITVENLKTVAAYYGIDDTAAENLVKNLKACTTVPKTGEWVITPDDRLYLPVALGLPLQQYDLLVVDNAGNLPIVARKLIGRLVRKTGTIVLVDDMNKDLAKGVRPGFLETVAQQVGCLRFGLQDGGKVEAGVEQDSNKKWIEQSESPRPTVSPLNKPEEDQAAPPKVDLASCDVIAHIREISEDNGRMHIATFKEKLAGYLEQWKESGVSKAEFETFEKAVKDGLSKIGNRAWVSSLIKALEGEEK